MRIARRANSYFPAQFVLLPFVVFVAVPAFVLKENSQAFATFDPLAFVPLIAIAIASAVALRSVDLIVRRLIGRPYVSRLVELSLFFVIITGFVLPASTASGMRDPEIAQVDGVHVALALVLAMALFLFSRSKYRFTLYLVTATFLFVNVATALPSIYSLLDRPDWSASDPDNTSLLSASRESNIFVLSFDGVSGSAVAEALQEDAELAERFSGFTFFDGVASSSPATSSSTATSLLGNRNFKLDYPTQEQVWQSAPERLMTNQLDRGGYTVSTYDMYNKGFESMDRRHDAIVQRAPPSTVGLLNFALARSLTRAFVVQGDLEEQLSNMFKQALATLGSPASELVNRFSASYSPDWKKDALTPTLLDFLGYVEQIRATNAVPVAQFLHFTHSHFPVEFDAGCRFRGDDATWFESRQNRDGVKEETRCTLSQFAGFLDKLKKIDAFDNALIVLKSDHGAPVRYGHPDSIESFRIRDHELWGYGRYRPFLAIKGFGAASGELVRDGSPVILDDLAITLCANADIEQDCSSYGGFDLLGGDFSGIEDDEVTLFVVASAESDHSYDNHEAITFKRGANIAQSLHARLSSDLLVSGVSCSSGIDVSLGETLDNGRSDRRSWLTWRDRGASFLRFRQDATCDSTTLRLQGEPPSGMVGGVVIVVNGRPIHVGSQADRTMPTGSNVILVDVPSEAVGTTGDVLVEVRVTGQEDGGFVDILGVDFDEA